MEFIWRLPSSEEALLLLDRRLVRVNKYKITSFITGTVSGFLSAARETEKIPLKYSEAESSAAAYL